jgi:hypothetical protein
MLSWSRAWALWGVGGAIGGIRGETNLVVHKDLALLLPLGLGHAHGRDHVQLRKAELLFCVDALLLLLALVEPLQVGATRDFFCWDFWLGAGFAFWFGDAVRGRPSGAALAAARAAGLGGGVLVLYRACGCH